MTGQPWSGRVRKLRAVLDRRPEDTYHVAAVASQILTLDVQWADALKPGDYSSFRRDMLEIGKVISEPRGISAFYILRPRSRR